MARWQRDVAKERTWRRHVAGWRRSGLSVRAYCAIEGLSEASFYAWRRTLAERDGHQAPPAKQRSRTESVPAFVPVRMVSEPAPSTPAGSVDVLLTNGRVLRLGADFDPHVVRQVLALLEEPTC